MLEFSLSLIWFSSWHSSQSRFLRPGIFFYFFFFLISTEKQNLLSLQR